MLDQMDTRTPLGRVGGARDHGSQEPNSTTANGALVRSASTD